MKQRDPVSMQRTLPTERISSFSVTGAEKYSHNTADFAFRPPCAARSAWNRLTDGRRASSRGFAELRSNEFQVVAAHS